jgi:tetrahydromethanopterin S-methyltransferase subunit F
MEDKNLFKYVDNVKLDDTQKAELISGEIPQFQVVRRRGGLGSFAPMAGMAAGVALVAVVLVGILSGGFDFFSTPADAGFPPSDSQIAMTVGVTGSVVFKTYSLDDYFDRYGRDRVKVVRVKALTSTKPAEIVRYGESGGVAAWLFSAFDIEILEVLNGEFHWEDGSETVGKKITVYAKPQYVSVNTYLEMLEYNNYWDIQRQGIVDPVSLRGLTEAQKDSMYVKYLSDNSYNFTDMTAGEEYILIIEYGSEVRVQVSGHGAFLPTDPEIYGLINKPEPPDEFKPTPPPELTYNPVALPAHLESLNWVVRPGYRYILEHDGTEYEGFYYCSSCDFFFNSGEFAVNERTGLYLEHSHGAHGGGRLSWIYDPINDMMGKNGSAYGGEPMRMYPRSEFAQHFPEAAGTIKIVHSVDMSMFNEGEQGPELTTDAYGLAAAAVGNEFITDFIYYDLSKEFWIRRGRDIADKIEVTDADGKRGVIGKDGIAVLPLEFEDILIIDKWTAFVKLDGHWGIVAFYDGDVPNFMPSGADSTYIEGDRISEEWHVVSENASLYIQNSNGERFFDLDFEKISNTGGRNIRGFRNNGSDVYEINARGTEFNLWQIRLEREWAVEILFNNDLIEYLQGDVLAAVSAVEHIIQMAQDYLFELGTEINAEYSYIQLYRAYNGEILENAFRFSVATTKDNNWVIFKAVLVNGEWEIHDVTQEVLG